MKKKSLFTIAAVLMIGFCGCASEDKSASAPDKGDISGIEAEATDVAQNVTGNPEGEEEQFALSDYNLEYGGKSEFKKIYEKRTNVENAEEFEGEFCRTDVPVAYDGTLIISDQDSTGFDFMLGCGYYSHYGYMEGEAEFVSQNVAIFEYTDEWTEEGEEQYVVFERTDDGINIFPSGGSSQLGFGMYVTADGFYVEGEPEYTNANILNDTFTLDEQEEIKAMLEGVYVECFKMVVEFGVIKAYDCELASGEQAVFYEAYIPTMGGYGFELLITENGEIYFCSETESVGWKTNVPGAIDFPEYECK